MIPKRSLSDISAPVSSPGKTPLPPEALKDGDVIEKTGAEPSSVPPHVWVDGPTATTPVFSGPAFTAKSQPERILERLQTYSKVTRLPETQDDLLNAMQKRGLLTVSSGYAVVSEKGIGYLVDFGMI